MSKRADEYPDDEFDVPVSHEVPGGSHRARRSVWRSVVPFVIVAVVAAGLAYALVVVLPKITDVTPDDIASAVGVESTTNESPAASDAPNGADSTPDATADDAGGTDADNAAKGVQSDDDTVTAGGSDGAAGTDDTPGTNAGDEPNVDETDADPSDLETPSPDLATTVSVLNSTQAKGLAARAATRLTDAGWTDVTAANYTGSAVSGSVIFYKDADDEVSARAVAAALGVTTVTKVSNLSAPVAAVLAADYAG